VPVGFDMVEERHDHRCLKVLEAECERCLTDLALDEGE